MPAFQISYSYRCAGCWGSVVEEETETPWDRIKKVLFAPALICWVVGPLAGAAITNGSTGGVADLLLLVFWITSFAVVGSLRAIHAFVIYIMKGKSGLRNMKAILYSREKDRFAPIGSKIVIINLLSGFLATTLIANDITIYI